MISFQKFCKYYTIFTLVFLILGFIGVCGFFHTLKPIKTISGIGVTFTIIALVNYIPNWLLNFAYLYHHCTEEVIRHKVIKTNAIIIGLCIFLSIIAPIPAAMPYHHGPNRIDYLECSYIIILLLIFIGWCINAWNIIVKKTAM